MAFPGSSRIRRVITGGVGPTGPTGPIGPTGDPGETGNDGRRGAFGIGISFAESFENGVIKGITFTLEDNTKLEVVGFTGTVTDGIPDDFTYIVNNENQDDETHARIFKGFTYAEGQEGNDSIPKIAQFRSLSILGSRLSVIGSTFDTLIINGSTFSSLGELGRLPYANAGNSAALSTNYLNTYIGNTLSVVINQLSERILDYTQTYLQTNWIYPGPITEITGNYLEEYRGYNPSKTIDESNTDGTVLPKNDLLELYGANIPLTYSDFKLIPYLDLGTADYATPNGPNDNNLLYKFKQHNTHGTTLSSFSNTIGSCCFCTSPDILTGEYGTTCFDYTTKNYCDSLLGTFSNTPCAIREEGPDCQDTYPCCVNGECVDTSIEKCDKFNGVLFKNIASCAALGSTCPNICPGQQGACCIDGVCYSFNEEDCAIVNGIFHANKNCDPYDIILNPNGYDCCLDSSPGACCITTDDTGEIGSGAQPGTNCYDNYTALQCYQAGGYYQGAGSSCLTDPNDQSVYDQVLIGYSPNGQAITRRCCQDPYDLNDTLNQTCQVRLNPCHTHELGASIEGGRYVGYLGYPASECGSALPVRGRTIRDLALSGNFTPLEYLPSVGRYDVINPCDHLPPVHVLPANPTSTSLPTLNYKTGHLSEIGLLLNNPFDESAEFYDPSDGAKFNEFAEKIYGRGYQIERRWAIIVADNDVNVGKGDAEIKWGLCNRIGPTVREEPLKNWATCVLDGYLNTKLYDNSVSGVWFWENAFGFDPEAYDRWVDPSTNPWGDADRAALENNEQEFIQAYTQMINENSSDTAMSASINYPPDNSFSDWYVPSIVELNHLNYIQEVRGINLNMSGEYWSSTSGYLKSSSQASPYGLPSAWMGGGNDEFNDSPWLSDPKLAYKAASGYYAFTQNFQNSAFSGVIHSRHKQFNTAKVRLIRRIPIYVASPLCYNPQSFPSIVDCNAGGPCTCGGDVLI